MIIKMVRALAVGLLLISLNHSTFAETKNRNTVWSIGLSGLRQTLKSGDGYNLLGSSSEVQLGWGYISTHWYSSISLDVISGPFQATHQDSLTLDFSGTGFTGIIGYSAEKGNLRTTEGSYGFALGFSYTDIIGRPVSNRLEIRDGSQVDQFTMRVNNFSIFPSIFFCWLLPERRLGNTPELLKTRLEGYILTIGIGVPLRANYKANINRTLIAETDESTTEDSDSTNSSDTQDTAPSDNEKISESIKGGLKGNTIVISFTALLGV